MPGAIIAIDQDRPGPSTSSGSDGVARKDLWLSRTIRPRSTQSGNGSQQWALLDKPTGSSATLANDTAVTCDFNPDLPGSYRLQLTTNDGGVGNVQVLVAAITFDTNGTILWNGWRTPAFAEKVPENNFGAQSRGWMPDIEKVISDIAPLLGFEPSSGKLTVRGAETVNKGTAQGEANTKEHQLKTTNNGFNNLATFAVSTNSMNLLEVEVMCIKSDASIGGYFKRSNTYLRAAGAVTAGAMKNIDRQMLGGVTTWDILLDEDGAGNARIRVDGKGDNVSWYVVRQNLKVTPIP